MAVGVFALGAAAIMPATGAQAQGTVSISSTVTELIEDGAAGIFTISLANLNIARGVETADINIQFGGTEDFTVIANTDEREWTNDKYKVTFPANTLKDGFNSAQRTGGSPSFRTNGVGRIRIRTDSAVIGGAGDTPDVQGTPASIPIQVQALTGSAGTGNMVSIIGTVKLRTRSDSERSEVTPNPAATSAFTIIAASESGATNLTGIGVTRTADGTAESLVQTFDPANLTYTAIVDSGVTSITVTPVAAAGASYAVTIPSGSDAVLTDGGTNEPAEIALTVGANNLMNITVTAGNRAVGDPPYTLNVTLLAAPTAAIVGTTGDVESGGGTGTFTVQIRNYNASLSGDDYLAVGLKAGLEIVPGGNLPGGGGRTGGLSEVRAGSGGDGSFRLTLDSAQTIGSGRGSSPEGVFFLDSTTANSFFVAVHQSQLSGGEANIVVNFETTANAGRDHLAIAFLNDNAQAYGDITNLAQPSAAIANSAIDNDDTTGSVTFRAMPSTVSTLRDATIETAMTPVQNFGGSNLTGSIAIDNTTTTRLEIFPTSNTAAIFICDNTPAEVTGGRQDGQGTYTHSTFPVSVGANVFTIYVSAQSVTAPTSCGLANTAAGLATTTAYTLTITVRPGATARPTQVEIADADEAASVSGFPTNTIDEGGTSVFSVVLDAPVAAGENVRLPYTFLGPDFGTGNDYTYAIDTPTAGTSLNDFTCDTADACNSSASTTTSVGPDASSGATVTFIPGERYKVFTVTALTDTVLESGGETLMFRVDAGTISAGGGDATIAVQRDEDGADIIINDVPTGARLAATNGLTLTPSDGGSAAIGVIGTVDTSTDPDSAAITVSVPFGTTSATARATAFDGNAVFGAIVNAPGGGVSVDTTIPANNSADGIPASVGAVVSQITDGDSFRFTVTPQTGDPVLYTVTITVRPQSPNTDATLRATNGLTLTPSDSVGAPIVNGTNAAIAVSVPFGTESVTAVATANDFAASFGTIAIDSGVAVGTTTRTNNGEDGARATATAEITAMGGGAFSTGDSFRFTLTPGTGAGVLYTVTITVTPAVLDSVEVTSAETAVNEGAAAFNITVELNTPVAAGETVTLPYTFSGGGIATTDFSYTVNGTATTGLTGNLVFIAGEDTKNIAVTVLDDGTVETGVETLKFKLTAGPGTTSGYNGVVVEATDEVDIAISDIPAGARLAATNGLTLTPSDGGSAAIGVINGRAITVSVPFGTTSATALATARDGNASFGRIVPNDPGSGVTVGATTHENNGTSGVSGTPATASVLVSGIGDDESESFRFTVTPETGDDVLYTVTITVRPRSTSTDATLAATDGLTLTPSDSVGAPVTVDATNASIAVSVPHGTETVTAVATANDFAATFGHIVNDNEVAVGTTTRTNNGEDGKRATATAEISADGGGPFSTGDAFRFSVAPGTGANVLYTVTITVLPPPSATIEQGPGLIQEGRANNAGYFDVVLENIDASSAHTVILALEFPGSEPFPTDDTDAETGDFTLTLGSVNWRQFQNIIRSDDETNSQRAFVFLDPSQFLANDPRTVGTTTTPQTSEPAGFERVTVNIRTNGDFDAATNDFITPRIVGLSFHAGVGVTGNSRPEASVISAAYEAGVTNVVAGNIDDRNARFEAVAVDDVPRATLTGTDLVIDPDTTGDTATFSLTTTNIPDEFNSQTVSGVFVALDLLGGGPITNNSGDGVQTDKWTLTHTQTGNALRSERSTLAAHPSRFLLAVPSGNGVVNFTLTAKEPAAQNDRITVSLANVELIAGTNTPLTTVNYEGTGGPLFIDFTADLRMVVSLADGAPSSIPLNGGETSFNLEIFGDYPDEVGTSNVEPETIFTGFTFPTDMTANARGTELSAVNGNYTITFGEHVGGAGSTWIVPDSENANEAFLRSGVGARFIELKVASDEDEEQDVEISIAEPTYHLNINQTPIPGSGSLTIEGSPISFSIRDTGFDLESLSVAGVSVPDFALGTREYDVGLPLRATSVAITAVAADSNATVAVSAVDRGTTLTTSGSCSGDEDTSGCMLTGLDSNTDAVVSIVVSPDGGVTERTYTVNLTAAATPTVTIATTGPRNVRLSGSGSSRMFTVTLKNVPKRAANTINDGASSGPGEPGFVADPFAIEDVRQVFLVMNLRDPANPDASPPSNFTNFGNISGNTGGVESDEWEIPAPNTGSDTVRNSNANVDARRMVNRIEFAADNSESPTYPDKTYTFTLTAKADAMDDNDLAITLSRVGWLAAGSGTAGALSNVPDGSQFGEPLTFGFDDPNFAQTRVLDPIAQDIVVGETGTVTLTLPDSVHEALAALSDEDRMNAAHLLLTADTSGGDGNAPEALELTADSMISLQEFDLVSTSAGLNFRGVNPIETVELYIDVTDDSLPESVTFTVSPQSSDANDDMLVLSVTDAVFRESSSSTDNIGNVITFGDDIPGRSITVNALADARTTTLAALSVQGKAVRDLSAVGQVSALADSALLDLDSTSAAGHGVVSIVAATDTPVAVTLTLDDTEDTSFITGVTDNPGVNLTGIDTEAVDGEETRTVMLSGFTSGTNLIQVGVIDADDSVDSDSDPNTTDRRVYAIRVHVTGLPTAAADDSTLSALSITGGTVTPGIAYGTEAYRVNLPNANAADITATPGNSGASVRICDAASLADGTGAQTATGAVISDDKVFTIYVTAAEDATGAAITPPASCTAASTAANTTTYTLTVDVLTTAAAGGVTALTNSVANGPGVVMGNFEYVITDYAMPATGEYLLVEMRTGSTPLQLFVGNNNITGSGTRTLIGADVVIEMIAPTPAGVHFVQAPNNDVNFYMAVPKELFADGAGNGTDPGDETIALRVTTGPNGATLAEYNFQASSGGNAAFSVPSVNYVMDGTEFRAGRIGPGRALTIATTSADLTVTAGTNSQLGSVVFNNISQTISPAFDPANSGPYEVLFPAGVTPAINSVFSLTPVIANSATALCSPDTVTPALNVDNVLASGPNDLVLLTGHLGTATAAKQYLLHVLDEGQATPADCAAAAEANRTTYTFNFRIAGGGAAMLTADRPVIVEGDSVVATNFTLGITGAGAGTASMTYELAGNGNISAGTVTYNSGEGSTTSAAAVVDGTATTISPITVQNDNTANITFSFAPADDADTSDGEITLTITEILTENATTVLDVTGLTATIDVVDDDRPTDSYNAGCEVGEVLRLGFACDLGVFNVRTGVHRDIVPDDPANSATVGNQPGIRQGNSTTAQKLSGTAGFFAAGDSENTYLELGTSNVWMIIREPVMPGTPGGPVFTRLVRDASTGVPGTAAALTLRAAQDAAEPDTAGFTNWLIYPTSPTAVADRADGEVMVSFQLGGSATYRTDYTVSVEAGLAADALMPVPVTDGASSDVVIATLPDADAGVIRYVDVTVTPRHDSDPAEGDETVEITIINVDYADDGTTNDITEDSATATIAIADGDAVTERTVTLARVDLGVIPDVDGRTPAWTIDVDGIAMDGVLNINYEMSGSATAGVDYTLAAGGATIDPSAASGVIRMGMITRAAKNTARIFIDPSTDATDEDTVIMTLTGVSSSDLESGVIDEVLLENPPVAERQLQLVEEAAPSAGIAPAAVIVNEDDTTPAEFTLTVNRGLTGLANTTDNAVVTLALTSATTPAAVRPTDYTITAVDAANAAITLGGTNTSPTFTITQAQFTATNPYVARIRIAPVDRDVVDGDKGVTITPAVRFGSGGDADDPAPDPASATATIRDRSDQTLAALAVEISGADVAVDGFAPGTTSYDVYVNAGATSTDITATANDSNASVRVCAGITNISAGGGGKYTVPVTAMVKPVVVYVTAARGALAGCSDAQVTARTHTTPYTLMLAAAPATGTTVIGDKNPPDVVNIVGTAEIPIKLSNFPEQVRVGTLPTNLEYVIVPISLLQSGVNNVTVEGTTINTSDTISEGSVITFAGFHTITLPGDVRAVATNISEFSTILALRVPVVSRPGDTLGADINLSITALDNASVPKSISFQAFSTGYAYVPMGVGTPGDSPPTIRDAVTGGNVFTIVAAGQPRAVVTINGSTSIPETSAGRVFNIALTGLATDPNDAPVVIPFRIDGSAANSATWGDGTSTNDYTISAGGGDGDGTTVDTFVTTSEGVTTGRITIPTTDQNADGTGSGSFTVVVRDDSTDTPEEVDPNETIVLEMRKEIGVVMPTDLTIGSPTVFNLRTVEEASADITPPTATATEGDTATGAELALSVSWGDIDSDNLANTAVVSFDITRGNGARASDYTVDVVDQAGVISGESVNSNTGTFTFAAGEDTREAIIRVVAEEESDIDPRETVTIAITSVVFGRTASLAEHLDGVGGDTFSSSIVTLGNNDARATLGAVSSPRIREKESDIPATATFDVVIDSAPTDEDATIVLTFGGNAEFGGGTTGAGDYSVTSDAADTYNVTANTMRVATSVSNGAASVEFTINVSDDDEPGESPNESISITLTSVNAGTAPNATVFALRTTAPNTLSIVDDDVAVGGFCSRSEKVLDAILGHSTITGKSCPVSGSTNGAVTEAELAAITGLLSVNAIANTARERLKPGDFAGLSGVTSLTLAGAQGDVLPDGVFTGLNALETLNISALMYGSLANGVLDDVLDTLTGANGLVFPTGHTAANIDFADNQPDAAPIGEGTTFTIAILNPAPTDVTVTATITGVGTPMDHITGLSRFTNGATVTPGTLPDTYDITIPAGVTSVGFDVDIDAEGVPAEDIGAADSITITLSDLTIPAQGDASGLVAVSGLAVIGSPDAVSFALSLPDITASFDTTSISIGEKAREERAIRLNLGGLHEAHGAITVEFTINEPTSNEDLIPTLAISGDGSLDVPYRPMGNADALDYRNGDYDLTVTHSADATLVDDDDGNVLVPAAGSNTFVLPANNSFADFTFKAGNDDRKEGSEIATLDITLVRIGTGGGTASTPAEATIEVKEVGVEDVMREVAPVAMIVGKQQVGLVTQLIRGRIAGRPAGIAPSVGTTVSLAENPETMQDFFSQLALEHSSDMDSGGKYAVWARGQYTSISGDPDIAGEPEFEYDGDISGAGFGIERRESNMLVGLSLNFSNADIKMESSIREKSTYKESMTFFAPYAAYKPDDTALTVWGTAGVGFGTAKINSESHNEGSPSVQVIFANAGVDYATPFARNSEIVFGVSALSISKTVEAFTLDVGAVPEIGSDTFQARGDMTLFMPVDFGDSVVRPYIGVSSVHDIGDVIADDKHAMEGKVGVSWLTGLWSVDVNAFTQFLREDEKAWGVFGEIGYAGVGDLDGLIMGMSGEHGTASSMSDAVAATDTASGGIDTDLSDADSEVPEWSLGMDAEYGFSAPLLHRAGRATPFLRGTHSGDAQTFGSGVRLDIDRNVGVTLESNRHLPANDDPYSEHAVGLEARWEF